jgi:nucleoside-diphosphate-sugar epimerase
MSPAWPDSTTFWRDKRVIVTGGSGFLGSFIVDKLRARGAAEVIVPRRDDYDLRDIQAIRQLFVDVAANAPLAPLPSTSFTWPPTSAGLGRIGSSRPSSSTTT